MSVSKREIHLAIYSMYLLAFSSEAAKSVADINMVCYFFINSISGLINLKKI